MNDTKYREVKQNIARILYDTFNQNTEEQMRAPWLQDKWMDTAEEIIKSIKASTDVGD